MAAKSAPVGVTELVLRDGHQSLIATRLRTEDMLPICGTLNRAGFWSLESWGGATFDSCVRYLREDPWERLRKLRLALPDSRLQMLLRGQNLLGYRHYGNEVVDAFVLAAVKNGMDVFRIFDALNDIRNMQTAIAAVKRAGKHAQGTICYTASPVHSVAGFVAFAEQLAEAGCDSLAVKDMSGIMLPAAAGELTAALKKKFSIPVHVHSHSTSGMAAMSLQAAVEAGADVIDTVASPFAWGASHPATETMAIALSSSPRAPQLDMAALDEIASYFHEVRGRYWQFESRESGTNPAVLRHHVPGGMISNLSNQLRQSGALNRIREILDEIPRVRKELGYPPMVTPMSQMVGAQAVRNVLEGSRYASVSNELRNYLNGRYGRIPGEVDKALLEKIGGEAGGDDAADHLPPPGELERMRDELGGLAQSDEDVLTCAMFPELGKVFLQERLAGELRPEPLLPPPTETSAAARAGFPSECRVIVHGEPYHIQLTGMGLPNAARRPLYFVVDGRPEEALVESLGGADSPADAPAESAESRRPKATLPGHISASMSGAVVSVLVKEGDQVEEGQPVLVMEAMKMENEIVSPVGGKVVGVLVKEGDAVQPGEMLVEIGD